MRKTQSGKVLLGILLGSTLLAMLGCWYEKNHPCNRNWTGYMSHCEVHGHIPLERALKEEARDREYRDMRPGERDYREHQDREIDRQSEQNTDFGSMS